MSFWKCAARKAATKRPCSRASCCGCTCATPKSAAGKWNCSNSNETGNGGYKEAVVEIHGEGAYSALKFESGVHRVQRVPATEASGRLHTSSATVIVMPEAEDVEIEINEEKDIEKQYTLSQGAGGQNVQKNMTAVRLIHKPTGIVVACQDQRSQLAELREGHSRPESPAVRH